MSLVLLGWIRKGTVLHGQSLASVPAEIYISDRMMPACVQNSAVGLIVLTWKSLGSMAAGEP